MNPDFPNNNSKQNNYYKYNNHNHHSNSGSSGYGMQNQNQYNPQLQHQQGQQQGNYMGMNMQNPYGGYLPDQYQNVYFNPYAGYQAQGAVPGTAPQNAYPYNFNYQGQQQPNQIFDQNANSQYQQMILNSLSANPILTQAGVANAPQGQATSQVPLGGQSMPLSSAVPLSQSQQDQYQIDLNNQYLQQMQIGGYMVPGYDFNQMNMIQAIPQDQINSQANTQTTQANNEGEEKKPSEGQNEN